MKVFEVHIRGGSRDGYRVDAEPPEGPRESGPLDLPHPDVLDQWLHEVQYAVVASTRQTRQRVGPHQATVQSVGRRLFEALPDRVADLLRDWMGRASGAGGLRVALRIDPPELARLPWELTYDPRREAHPFLHHHLLRHLPDSPSEPPTLARQTLRMLAMTGCAEGLDPEWEERLLQEALAQPVDHNRLTLTWVRRSTWRDLHEQIRSRQYHIFHFIGHGYHDHANEESGIVLDDGQESGHRVPARQLAEFLRGAVRLVVLNACDTAQADRQDLFSSVAATLIRAGVPAVVAMQFEITDRAARDFSRDFYRALADAQPVPEAVTAARMGVWGEAESLEWSTPVLYMRSPDEVVFQVWRPAKARHLELPRPVTAVAFSPRSAELALAQEGVARPVRVPVTTLKPPATGSALRDRLAALIFSPQTNALAYDPASERLAGAGDDCTVRIYRDPTDQRPQRLDNRSRVLDLAFPPEGRRLATAGADGVVRVWSIDSAEVRQPEHRLPVAPPVRAVSWGHPAGWLAAGGGTGDGGLATIWRPAGDGWAEVARLPHPDAVWGVAFHRDGILLATACGDGRARIWRCDDPGDPVGSLPHDEPVRAVSFSPDGQLIATASDDRACVWEAGTGQETFTVRHEGPVRRVVFSPDGRWLATAGDDCVSQVWSLADLDVLEVSYNERVPPESVEELEEILHDFRLATRTVFEPARREHFLPDLAVVITGAIEHVIKTLLAIGEAAARRRLAEWLHRRRGKIGVIDLRYPQVTFQVDEKVLLQPPVPADAMRQLAELDLSNCPKGTVVQYHEELHRWLVRRP